MRRTALSWGIVIVLGALADYLTVRYHLYAAVFNPILPYFVATLIFLPPWQAGCAFLVATSYTTYHQVTAPGVPLLEVGERIALITALFLLIVSVKQRLVRRSIRQRAAERRAAELAAEEAELRAQAAERRAHDRSTFMSAAAHELRTPLTALRGYAEIATDVLRKTDQLLAAHAPSQPLSPDYAQQRQRFARVLPAISRQAEKMEHLVDLLLDVTRLEQGRLGLDARPTDLCALLVDGVQGAQLADPDHPINLDAPPGPLVVTCDPLRVEQILVNLLVNAQQYSPVGSTIGVQLVGWDRQVVLRVSDAGPGIPVEERSAVFQRFYQIGRTERSQGLGIGLFLVKEFVELHDGTVAITDGPDGTGTTVEVRLPLTRTV